MFSKQHKTIGLRFRKWRRKSYAAFHSIGRHVTIGNVKNIVADTLLRKQKTVEQEKNLVFSLLSSKAFEEPDDPLTEVQLVLEAISVVSKRKNYDERYFRSAIYFSNRLKTTSLVGFSLFCFITTLSFLTSHFYLPISNKRSKTLFFKNDNAPFCKGIGADLIGLNVFGKKNIYSRFYDNKYKE